MCAVHVKVSLVSYGEIVENSRILLKKDISFNGFQNRLVEIFPSLSDSNFSIYWNDEDGDDIMISNDEELVCAITAMPDKLKRFYVFSDKDIDVTQISHFNVFCNACRIKNFKGFRYKCLICWNYHLCEECESRHMHPEHFMIRIPEHVSERYAALFYKNMNVLRNIWQGNAIPLDCEMDNTDRDSFRYANGRNRKNGDDTARDNVHDFVGGSQRNRRRRPKFKLPKCSDIISNFADIYDTFVNPIVTEKDNTTNHNQATMNVVENVGHVFAEIINPFVDAVRVGIGTSRRFRTPTDDDPYAQRSSHEDNRENNNINNDKLDKNSNAGGVFHGNGSPPPSTPAEDSAATSDEEKANSNPAAAAMKDGLKTTQRQRTIEL